MADRLLIHHRAVNSVIIIIFLTTVVLFVMGSVSRKVKKKKDAVVPITVMQKTQEKDTTDAAEKKRSVKRQRTLVKKITLPLDLNTATYEDLCLVKGVGPVMAKNILAYREKYGTFTSVEDLKKIKGIGDKRYQTLAGCFIVR